MYLSTICTRSGTQTVNAASSSNYGDSGNSGLALIASLQSTDAGAAMTRQLKDEGHLTKRETDVFTMFQFTAGATIVNFFSSGAVLFTLTMADGSFAVTSSIGLAVVVMFLF